MAKMHLGLTATTLMAIIAFPVVASADGIDARPRHHYHRVGPAPIYHYEDRCGCLNVTYDYHRELKLTYGSQVDPRGYDETEPHFYYGAMKAYPRFWSTPSSPW